MAETVASHQHHVESDGHRFVLHVERHLATAHSVRIVTDPDPPLSEGALMSIHDVIHTLGIAPPVAS